MTQSTRPQSRATDLQHIIESEQKVTCKSPRRRPRGRPRKTGPAGALLGRTSAHPISGERQLRRKVLKRLAAGPGTWQREISDLGVGNKDLLVASDLEASSTSSSLEAPQNTPRSLSLPEGLLTRMRADGLVRGALGAHIEITPEGRLWLHRTLSGVVDDGAFAAQHQERQPCQLQTADGQTEDLLVNLSESPLGWLRRRGHITALQFDAGERLRADFTFAQLVARPSGGWRVETGGGNGGLAGQELTDAVLNARQRLERVLSGMDDTLRDLVVDVCCNLRGLKDVEHARGWPARSGKVVLGVALDSLATQYGITPGRRERGPGPAGTRR